MPGTFFFSPGPRYGTSGAVGYFYQAIAISGGRVLLDTDVGMSVSIASVGAYVKPQKLRISAALHLNTLADFGDSAARGIGLGFYTGFTPNPTGTGLHGHDNGARGLVLERSGKVTLSVSGSLDSGLSIPYQSALFGGSAFDPAVTHTLAYQVDTVGGSITDIRLDGVAVGSLSTSSFTNASTPRAGFWCSSQSAGCTGYVDNFLVEGVVPSVQESWILSYFGTPSNTGNAADTADPDSDGLPNLIEWACNRNPTTGSALSLTASKVATNTEFTYPRSVAALNAGTGFIVEWSDTLATGTWGSVGVSETIISDNGTEQQVKATFPSGSTGHRFVRLKVTGPP